MVTLSGSAQCPNFCPVVLEEWLPSMLSLEDDPVFSLFI